MDTCARTLIAVEKMINDGSYETFLKQRYESWNENSELMNKLSLEDIHNKVIKENINPDPKSGRQEYLENLINSFVE
jgi:xylose isomerase